MVGDTVNTASRLESLNKLMDLKIKRPYNIILSAATFEQIRDDYETDSLGTTPIRGREEMMALYTAIAPKTSNVNSKKS